MCPGDVVVVGAERHGHELHWALSSHTRGEPVGCSRPWDSSTITGRWTVCSSGSAARGSARSTRWATTPDVGCSASGRRHRVRRCSASPLSVMGRSMCSTRRCSVGPNVLWGDGFVACEREHHDACAVRDARALQPARDDRARLHRGRLRVAAPQLRCSAETWGERTMIGAGAVVLPGVTISMMFRWVRALW